MMRVRFALLALAAIAFGSSGAVAACPAERAVYRLKADRAYSAALVPARHHASSVSRLYLRVSSRDRSWWFIFGATHGYGGLFVEPVTDPTAPAAADAGPDKLLKGDAQPFAFYSLTKALDLLDVAPQPTEDAPEAFFIPQLGSTLWYSPANLSGDASAKAEAMPRSLFVRVACQVRAHAPAYP
jgi:hypothetical protein